MSITQVIFIAIAEVGLDTSNLEVCSTGIGPYVSVYVMYGTYRCVIRVDKEDVRSFTLDKLPRAIEDICKLYKEEPDDVDYSGMLQLLETVTHIA